MRHEEGEVFRLGPNMNLVSRRICLAPTTSGTGLIRTPPPQPPQATSSPIPGHLQARSPSQGGQEAEGPLASGLVVIKGLTYGFWALSPDELTHAVIILVHACQEHRFVKGSFKYTTIKIFVTVLACFHFKNMFNWTNRGLFHPLRRLECTVTKRTQAESNLSCRQHHPWWNGG